MSSFVKYKIREVAKDFDMPAKSIVNMVTELLKRRNPALRCFRMTSSIWCSI